VLAAAARRSKEQAAMAKRILVIDDTQDLLDLFAELLTEAGYGVRLQAACPADLEAVKRARPDLIISDYVPAQTRGSRRLLQQLKLDPETAAIPLLVCTTSSMLPRDHADWLHANGVEVVAKPFDVEVLLEAVAQQLGRAAADPMASAGDVNGVCV
jgi:CheY-like chemotaxis protein